MAIRTPDIALRDLVAHGTQAVSTSCQHGHRKPLGLTVAMVELQDPNVCDSAVDARMIAEVANQPRADLFDYSDLTAPGLGQVVVPIGPIVLPPPRASAIKAERFTSDSHVHCHNRTAVPAFWLF